MKKFTKILFCLLGLPLLMANSPAPYARASSYTDYTVTDLEYVTEDEDYYFYESTITNTGDGFICIDELMYSPIESNVSTGYLDIYYEEVIPKNGTFTGCYKFYKEHFDLSKVELNVFAYTDVIADKVTSITIKDVSKNSYGVYVDNVPTYKYYYSIDYSIEYSEDLDTSKSYSGIFVTEFAGETHYFFYSYVYNTLTISSDKDVDPSTITISDVYLIQNKTGGGGRTPYVILLVIMGIFSLIIPISLFVGITIALIFLIRGIIKKNKNKKNKENGEVKEANQEIPENSNTAIEPTDNETSQISEK